MLLDHDLAHEWNRVFVWLRYQLHPLVRFQQNKSRDKPNNTKVFCMIDLIFANVYESKLQLLEKKSVCSFIQRGKLFNANIKAVVAVSFWHNFCVVVYLEKGSTKKFPDCWQICGGHVLCQL